MWIYTILTCGYSAVENYNTKLSQKSKEKVMFMVKLSVSFLMSAIILQGTSMFLYLQYKVIK
ncbi:hypothetical protein [Fusobacterium polymorphum]|uniref:hypothetical protein n=1 Tax=Fusobacterium nucleatum subsp. polymorphum TaxID=76857 RepID=UPI0030081CED